jgi:hypothetical protein
VLEHQFVAKTRQPGTGHFECLGIAVKPQEPARLQVLQDRFRVPPRPERRVDVSAVWADVEEIENFTHENRNVRTPGLRRELRIVTGLVIHHRISDKQSASPDTEAVQRVPFLVRQRPGHGLANPLKA